MFVQVRNINPIGAVLTVLDGEAREVAKGAVVQVTPEQAGVGPHWRKALKDEVVEPHQRIRDSQGFEVPDRPQASFVVGDEAELEVYDLGSGLLAQVGNWEAVETTAKEKS